ncbi:DUF5062 family protein [Pseudoalteromonas sp. C2R02]|jgi:hypothetical protein|uniref:DUF5062 family protein n=1 Tax=Pseudoalteromonas sp. C2R02 TaxID=2841565 RepID=UPI001C08E54B|nr:DUF5062 family protein [Pseudoalteromonas sp. C2R02]MBU2968596.1 DUF5062 family protein [Pseudoalteromonas sp. C2R02]
MKKLKNETALLKQAIIIGEVYANNRGYKKFSGTNSAKEKIESLYRLLVSDKLIQPLKEEDENQLNMKHRLAVWISKQLPKDHELLK